MPNTELIQSLVVVIAFLLAVFFLSSYLKRAVANKKVSNLGLEFKIISKLPLSNKSFLYIVQIGSYFLLVGASENNISAIADLTKVFQNSSHRYSLPDLPLQNKENGGSDITSDFSFLNFLKETFKKSKN